MLDAVQFDLNQSSIARLVHELSVDSTMDLAHRLAEDGAPTGTVIVADVQKAGRGRGGKVWHSAAGDGLWCTLIAREINADALGVMSLRVGLAIAETLAPRSRDVIGVKWPNDVLQIPPELTSASHRTRALLAEVADNGMRRNPAEVPASQLRKLAGVLIEARWREARVEWLAIGMGINIRVPSAAPPELRVGSLIAGVSRAELLTALIPRVREAVSRSGELDTAELDAWRVRDVAVGRRCTAPDSGVVSGLRADGALCVRLDDGNTSAHRSGSLIFDEDFSTC